MTTLEVTEQEQEKKALTLYDAEEYQQAFDIFMELATTHNNAYAMQYLAVMYSSAEGVALDFDKAIEWDSKAIELGNTASMANLAITYRMRGDIIDAKYWFQQSIQAGDIDSALPLAKLYMVSNKETATIRQLLQTLLDAASQEPEFFCEDDIAEATELFVTMI